MVLGGRFGDGFSPVLFPGGVDPKVLIFHGLDLGKVDRVGIVARDVGFPHVTEYIYLLVRIELFGSG